jgi:hypothetical protein
MTRGAAGPAGRPPGGDVRGVSGRAVAAEATRIVDPDADPDADPDRTPDSHVGVSRPPSLPRHGCRAAGPSWRPGCGGAAGPARPGALQLQSGDSALESNLDLRRPGRPLRVPPEWGCPFASPTAPPSAPANSNGAVLQRPGAPSESEGLGVRRTRRPRRTRPRTRRRGRDPPGSASRLRRTGPAAVRPLLSG